MIQIYMMNSRTNFLNTLYVPIDKNMSHIFSIQTLYPAILHDLHSILSPTSGEKLNNPIPKDHEMPMQDLHFIVSAFTLFD